MNKPATHTKSMRDRLYDGADRFLWGVQAHIALSDLRSGSGFGGRLPELSGRSVLLAPQDQLAAAVAMIELDGVARRMIICPPDVSAEHLHEVIGRAGVEAIVSEHDRSDT